jgi:Transport and Golgi organisation 2
MCTAILSLEPGAPALLAGVRDEMADRAWEPPGQHWPDYPGVIGGRDLQAGGTWLALDPGAGRVACVLNGRGRMAPEQARRSRGLLPLQAAVDGKPPRAGLADFDPFHLLSVEPGTAMLWSWDGEGLTEQELTAGLHLVVNSGLNPGGPGDEVGSADPAAARESIAREHERARIAHFLPRLRAAARPRPRPGRPVEEAWESWLPLMNGDGLDPSDPRALIVRRDLGAGRIWGTTSISLVALAPDGSRYDFTGRPGDPGAWYPVPPG